MRFARAFALPFTIGCILSGVTFVLVSAQHPTQAITAGFWTKIGVDLRNINTGNIGVGTSTPGERLTVAGTVHSESGGFKFPDGTVQTTAAANGPIAFDFGTNTSGGLQAVSPKICYGRTVVPSSNGITISGLPFTSANSYSVVITKQASQAPAVWVTITSGSSFSLGYAAAEGNTIPVTWMAIGS
ncbi:MAG: hypothetical protein ACKVXR_15560 [Planctomycetota bacterium]